MKGKMVRINATINKDLLDRVKWYAEEHLEDRSTAIRQLIAKGLVVAQEDDATRAYQEGRVTLREAAKMLGLHPLDMQTLLVAKGIPIQDLRKEEMQERLGLVKRYVV